jgi:hypothetical protein
MKTHYHLLPTIIIAFGIQSETAKAASSPDPALPASSPIINPTAKSSGKGGHAIISSGPITFNYHGVQAEEINEAINEAFKKSTQNMLSEYKKLQKENSEQQDAATKDNNTRVNNTINETIKKLSDIKPNLATNQEPEITTVIEEIKEYKNKRKQIITTQADIIGPIDPTSRTVLLSLITEDETIAETLLLDIREKIEEARRNTIKILSDTNKIKDILRENMAYSLKLHTYAKPSIHLELIPTPPKKEPNIDYFGYISATRFATTQRVPTLPGMHSSPIENTYKPIAIGGGVRFFRPAFYAEGSIGGQANLRYFESSIQIGSEFKLWGNYFWAPSCGYTFTTRKSIPTYEFDPFGNTNQFEEKISKWQFGCAIRLTYGNNIYRTNH